MINIKFPDGAVRQYEAGISADGIAKSISEGLARKVLAASVNGEVWDASRPITSHSRLQLLTWNDLEAKSTFWHSSAHILAQSILDFYPNAKLDKNDIYLDNWVMFKSDQISFPEIVSIKNILNWINEINGDSFSSESEYLKVWKSYSLSNFSLERTITRGEFSVLVDKIIDPFSNVNVDYYGNIIY